MTQGGGISVHRAYASHTPKWQRFQTSITLPSNKAAAAPVAQDQPLHPYQRQYSHVYAQRLAMLKPRCWQAYHNGSKCNNHDDDATEVSRVLELQEDVPSVVVGTLVKSSNGGDGETLHKDSKCHDNDVLLLEDESGRVELNVENKHEWCTGVVVAVVGTVLADNGGVMEVQEMIPPASMPQPSLEGELQATSDGAAPHLLLVSGLECGSNEVSSLPRDMLLSYLEGHFSPTAASKVCQVVVAGGGCAVVKKKETAFAVQELDAWMSQVCAAGIPVDLIPGQHDPTTGNWPQRPLHSCLLKHSTTFLSSTRTPNPYASGMGDKLVMGSDGLNVSDLTTVLLDSNKHPVSELEALKRTLEWGHLCPTGPNSVPTVPHPETDPMVLTETPHVYFCGNCKAFDTDLVKQGDDKTRLVCVPRFADTKEAVLVNLETLDCELVRFEDEAV